MFKAFPELRRILWGAEFWEDGFYVRSVGDEVTEEVIRLIGAVHLRAEEVVRAAQHARASRLAPVARERVVPVRRALRRLHERERDA